MNAERIKLLDPLDRTSIANRVDRVYLKLYFLECLPLSSDYPLSSDLTPKP